MAISRIVYMTKNVYYFQLSNPYMETEGAKLELVIIDWQSSTIELFQVDSGNASCTNCAY